MQSTASVTYSEALLNNEQMFGTQSIVENSDNSLQHTLDSSKTPVNTAVTTTNNNTNNSNYTFTKDQSQSRYFMPNSTSSSTTKLNTANNSFLDLQKLNSRFVSNNQSFNGKKNTSNNSTLTSNSMYNLDSIATPTAMNDLLAMLDQEEENQKLFNGNVISQNIEASNTTNTSTGSDNGNNFSQLISPKSEDYNSSNEINIFTPIQENSTSSNVTSNSNSNNNVFIDVSNLNNNYNTENWKNIIDSFMSPEDFQNGRKDSTIGNNDILEHELEKTVIPGRRPSEMITPEENFPIMNNARQSISHSVDFWNLPNNKISPLSEPDEKIFNTELNQALNEYNMDFNSEKRNSYDNNQNNNNINELNNNVVLNSPKQNLDTQASNEFQFQSIMKNNDSNSIPMLSDTRSNELFYSLYNQMEPVNLDYYNMTQTDNNINNQSKNKNKQAGDGVSSPKKKFIKPSMMLSDAASISAKLAITSLQKKQETFPTIDNQVYHHPTKIVKRKSVSYVSPSNARNESSRRRRKSTIGIPTPNQVNNTMSPFSESPRTSTSGPSSKRNSGSNDSSSSTILEDRSVKPFQCSECEKAFRRSEHLKRHIRSVHSSDRPFPCMLCEKKFSRSDNLSQHLKTHKKHGDF